MMTRTEMLLDILIEECAEVIQAVTKAKRFGLQEIEPGQSLTNLEQLMYELNDVAATANLLSDHWVDSDLLIAKRRKIENYLLERSVEYREYSTLGKA